MTESAFEWFLWWWHREWIGFKFEKQRGPMRGYNILVGENDRMELKMKKIELILKIPIK